MTPEDAFIDFWRAVGLAPHDASRVVIEPGRLIRYRVQGDKPGSKNGAARFWLDPVPMGLVWTFRDEHAKHAWRSSERPSLTRAERAEYARRMDALRRAQEADRRAEQERVRAKAAKLWDASRPASNGHPYLQAKGVRSYGLKELGGRLLVPLRDRQGVLHSLQFIDGDGQKRFLTGGRVSACYCPIGRPAGVLLVCEGYATAATLHQATGHATAAAMNAGNLARVAVALRGKFPDARIVICADDDAGTPGNPGLTAAAEAARAAGGVVAVPALVREPTPCLNNPGPLTS